MKEPKYHLYSSATEHSEIVKSLIRFKNKLHSEGRYTDAVDDLIIKFSSVKMKSIRIKQSTKREQTLTASSRFYFVTRHCIILASRPFMDRFVQNGILSR